jgi:ketosteroid isomerase-like protein
MLMMSVSCIKSQNKTDIKMENELRNQLTSATSTFFQLLENRDIDKWIDLWAEDGIDRKPYATGMFPEEIIGKKAIYDAWKGITQVFDSVSFPIHEFIVDEENRTVVVRLDGKGLMKNGNIYQNTYIFLIHYDRNIKIIECYEYFNPYAAGKAFGKLDKLKY